MVCAFCGTLNAADIPDCNHCGRPLAAERAECCAAHPDRRAVARCARCDAPLCDECDILVEGTAYCAAHATALQGSAPESSLEAMPVVDVTAKPAATFAERLQAGLIDLALIVVAVLIFYLVLWALSGSPPTGPDSGAWRPVFNAVVLLGVLGYMGVQGFSCGQTAGKMLTDIIVLRADGTLMPPSMSFVRAILAWFGFVLGGIGFWYILWDPERRALHDRLMGTIVVHD